MVKEVTKEKAKRVDEYKQLPATIGVHHKTLKSLRDEAAKARQAGQYALAYGLVTREEFTKALADGEAGLIEPAKLPDNLRTAIAELTQAEVDEAANDKAVKDGREALRRPKRDPTPRTSPAKPSFATTSGKYHL